MEVESK